MPRYCAAYDCNNADNKESCRGISFHRFPLRDKLLMKKWMHNIKRDFEPNANSQICSEHFEEDCFEYQPFTNRRQLKKNAIPTKFSFVPKKTTRKRTSYTVGNVESPIRNEDTDNIIASSSTSTSTSTQTEVTFSSLVDEISEKNKIIEDLNSKVEKKFSPHHMTDEELKSFSGFNKETFFKIYHFLNLEEDLSVEKCKLPPLKQYFLFMLRLRKGFTLDMLAYIFEVSIATASRIFKTVTSLIYDKIKRISIWPDRDTISEFMPPAFKLKYPNCRVIIDCTEFEIQKPFSPSEQQMTFSNYKNRNTVKALVGIAPSGGISFISNLWCGAVSDKALFCESNLLKLLEPGDLVLADKGFRISDELRAIGCNLVQPIFLVDKIQFSLTERAHNKSVSHLRVHIERAIARIKYFKFFEGLIPYSSFHNLNELFYIAAFLTNFRQPLINLSPVELEDKENIEEDTSIKNMGAAGPSCEYPFRDPGPRDTGDEI